MKMPKLLRRRGSREKGAVLVELAMVVPVLVIVVMGIVDFGVLFSEKIDLRNGVREASWNSSRAIFGSTNECALTFSGVAPALQTRQTLCMAKYRSELPHADTRVKLIFVDMEDPANPGTYGFGNGLMVCAMYPSHSTTKFYSPVLDTKAQKVRLTTVVVGESDPPLEAAEETPLAGQNWDWCDPTVAPPT